MSASSPLMTDLLELAERLERATGPDRELDKAIHGLLFPPRPVATDEDQPPPGFGSGFLSGDYWGSGYTSSIDAAMTLVPEGWDRIEQEQSRERAWARITVHRNGFAPQYESRAATPALALCAAALRALAQSGEKM